MRETNRTRLRERDIPLRRSFASFPKTDGETLLAVTRLGGHVNVRDGETDQNMAHVMRVRLGRE